MASAVFRPGGAMLARSVQPKRGFLVNTSDTLVVMVIIELRYGLNILKMTVLALGLGFLGAR